MNSRTPAITTLLASFSAALLFSAQLSASPLPYEAVYQAEIKGMNVRMKRNLSVDGDQLSLSMRAKKLIFAISEESELSLEDGNKLRAQRYRHQRRNLGDRKDRDAQFDWTKNTVVDVLNDQQKPIAIDYPVFDKISYQEQFRIDLIANPEQQAFEYQITDGRSVKVYAFKHIGEELIDTPLGRLRTVKFKRDRGDSERQTYIWFAKDWHYLLARLDQIESKDAKPERLEIREAKIGDQQIVGLDAEGLGKELPEELDEGL